MVEHRDDGQIVSDSEDCDGPWSVPSSADTSKAYLPVLLFLEMLEELPGLTASSVSKLASAKAGCE